MAEAAQLSEDAIRTYLQVLEDPTRAIDENAIHEQEQVASTADDVIDRLHALAALERLRHPDLTEVEDGFVAVARDWASENQVPASAFVEVGVPAEVLRRAGFDVPHGRSRQGKKSEKARPAGSRSRVSREIVRTAMMSYASEFTVAEIAQRLGANDVTVRKAAEDLVTNGDLRKLPPRSDHVGPGRAPARYEVIRD